MPCERYPGGLTITRTGPTEELIRESKGERWCFACRKHREFLFVVRGEIAPSYYDPNPSIECTACGRSDTDLFPGRIREWE